jgi:phage baseplate assembly protein V
MDGLSNIRGRLGELERKVSRMVRMGTVDTVDRTKCRVTVTFDAPPTPGKPSDRLCKSESLPVLVEQSVENRDYWMPAIGEQVVCVFLPTGPGFVLGSFYSDEDPIPDGAEVDGVRAVELADGARFDYDTENSRGRVLLGDMDIEITPDHVRLLAGDIETEFTVEHVRMGGASANQPFVRGTDLKTLIEALIDLIVAQTHPTGVGPSGPPTNSAAFTAKKAEVAGILSTIIKGR